MSRNKFSSNGPKNLKYTVKHLLGYLGREKYSFIAGGLLVLLYASCDLLGTYMIKPVVNGILDGGGLSTLFHLYAAASELCFRRTCFSLEPSGTI